MVRVIKTKFKLNSTTEVKFKSKIPSQAVTGPGIIGIKLPIIPSKQKIKPMIIRIKSNLKLNFEAGLLFHKL